MYTMFNSFRLSKQIKVDFARPQLDAQYFILSQY